MKIRHWIVPALFISAIMDGYIAVSHRVSGQPDWNPLRFSVFFILMAGIFYYHCRNSKMIPSYGISLFIGKDHTAKRDGQYDYLRVLAAVSVICVHALNEAASGMELHSFMWNVYTALAALFLTCNLIYVMISGALLLGMKEDGLFSFYWKRFVKTAVPMFAYYLIYAAVHGGIQNLYPANLPKLFADMLAGPPEGAPHFWLIYIILSLYLVVPFLRLMLFYMTDRLLRALVILFLIFQAGTAYLPLFRLSLGLEWMFGAWMGIFILGYFLSHPAGKSWRLPMVVLGSCSAIITFWGVCSIPQYESLFYNTVPTMTFMAAGIFSLVQLCRSRLSRPGWVIRTLSHYSYSLILIHWYVLYYIVKGRLGITNCLGMILATLLFSYVIAWVYDNTAVFLLKSLLQSVYSKINCRH